MLPCARGLPASPLPLHQPADPLPPSAPASSPAALPYHSAVGHQHDDFDPFEIPMPTLKSEWTPEQAFAKMDEDGDGIVKGREFRAISESGMFNVMPTENFKNFAVFGALAHRHRVSP